MRVSDLSLNADTHEVARGERAIDLTQREFELLEYLMRNERIVISRQRLLDEVWGYDPFSQTNTIEVFVSNVRRKLEAGGRTPPIAHDPGSRLRPPRLAVLGALPAQRPSERPRDGGLIACRSAPAWQRLGAADVRDPVRLRARDRLADRPPHPRRLQPEVAASADDCLQLRSR